MQDPSIAESLVQKSPILVGLCLQGSLAKQH